MKMKRDFYQRTGLELGKDLLGLILVHETEKGITKGRIVETEAYMGPIDKAAHSYGNRKSIRTQIQYKEGGFAYIYLIYGMHSCMNVVCNIEGIPESVLIRSLEPVEGIELMKERRNTDKILNLCSGPGKLCQAMGITREHYGMDLCGDKLYIEEPELTGDIGNSFEIEQSKRINIDYAEEAKDFEWRFTIKGSKFVSK